METRKFLLGLTLIVILVFCMIIWFYPPTGDFNTDNPSWNGLTAVSEYRQVTPLKTLDALPTNRETALIMIPYEQFTNPELEQLRNYVSAGGTLVLLDDYGFGNQILTELGLQVRFSGKPLLDPLFDYQNQFMPKITSFSPESLTANISSVVFNHATTLENTAGVSVLASSSRFSFLDDNNNGEYDSGELGGHFPVMAYQKVGDGYVVVIADPSLLINGMVNLDDNLHLVDNVINIQGNNPAVYLDQSHLPKNPLDEAKAGLAIVYTVVASPLGTLSLIAIVLAISLRPFWKRVRKHEEKR